MNESLLEDIARLVEVARRPGMAGITPGEHQAIQRVEAYLADPESAERDREGDEDPMVEAFGDLADDLQAAGFENLNEVREATDEELLSVDGIGPKRLEQIRTALE